jgi:hypothetical protein
LKEKKKILPVKEKNELTKNCFWIPEKTPENKNNSSQKIIEYII